MGVYWCVCNNPPRAQNGKSALISSWATQHGCCHTVHPDSAMGNAPVAVLFYHFGVNKKDALSFLGPGYAGGSIHTSCPLAP